MEAMKTAAQSGSERLKEAAAEKMKRAEEYLDQIQVKDADLDRTEESSNLDGMMKLSDTDTIGGKHIPLNLLIELGVMRGVSFARAAGPDQSFEAYDIVAQLKPAYTGYKEKDEDQLLAAIAVSPDLTSQQVSIEEAGRVLAMFLCHRNANNDECLRFPSQTPVPNSIRSVWKSKPSFFIKNSSLRNCDDVR